MDDQKASVYGLKDRRNDELFYVGMSVEPYARYGEHLAVRVAKDAKGSRILDMRKDGILPELLIFEQNIEPSNALKRENHWIQYHLALGAPLTNIKMKGKKKQEKPIVSQPATDIHLVTMPNNKKYGEFLAVYEIRQILQENNLEEQPYLGEIERSAGCCKNIYNTRLFLKEDVLAYIGKHQKKTSLNRKRHNLGYVATA